jgi:hypothetical protein
VSVLDSRTMSPEAAGRMCVLRGVPSLVRDEAVKIISVRSLFPPDLRSAAAPCNTRTYTEVRGQRMSRQAIG